MAINFRLTEAAKGFFSDLRKRNDLSTDFDVFYFCAMLGMAYNRKGQVNSSNSNDIIDRYPERFKDKSKILVGSLLACELAALGIPFNDKKTVHNEIRKLVDPQAPSFLSDAGINVFNAFSAGGFDVLTENLDEKPRSLEEFLVIYHRVMTLKG